MAVDLQRLTQHDMIGECPIFHTQQMVRGSSAPGSGGSDPSGENSLTTVTASAPARSATANEDEDANDDRGVISLPWQNRD